MIIKIISKVKIHIFFYILIFISVLTGNFKDFLTFTLLILFHELGHIVFGIYYKWDIEKIVILPFGAITIFNTDINKSFKEEFMISIMGFVFQFILYIILKKFNISNLFMLNYSIFLFNILPIFPLDGYKILNSILNIFFSFKLSNIISLVISFIILIPLILYKNLILYLIILFLLISTIEEIKFFNFKYIKFLLERKNKQFCYKKYKIINELNLNKMFKYYKNIFYIDNLYHTEEEILRKKFDFY